MSADLAEQWKRCWSRSKSRHYYLNKLTGQKVWRVESKRPSQLVFEDSPVVALERERLREAALDALAAVTDRMGPLKGDSKTSRSCQRDGTRVGMQGIYSRVLWTQLMEQARRQGEINSSRADPAFPSHVSPAEDSAVLDELIAAGRSEAQATDTYNVIASHLTAASSSMLRLAASEQSQLESRRVAVTPTLREELLIASHMFQLALPRGTSARPYPIRGDHLLKLLRLYRLHTAPATTCDDPTFLRRVFCVIARYETISGISDGCKLTHSLYTAESAGGL